MTASSPPSRKPVGIGGIVAAGMAPGLAWFMLLVAGSQLDEDMCDTGAAPHRGRWFGVSVRLPLAVLAGVSVLLTIVAAVVLMRSWRATRIATAQVAETRAFLSMISLISLGLFVPMIVASVVQFLVVQTC